MIVEKKTIERSKPLSKVEKEKCIEIWKNNQKRRQEAYIQN
jgi:predicted nucleic acid-binding Zn ribbon protein